MPEEIVLEDGTKREVLTDEEVKDLKAGHDANQEKRPIVKQHGELIESLELEEGQTPAEKIKQLKDAENPNWKKMRETLKSLRTVAKEKGVEIDDDGNIVSKPEGLTAEKTADIANSIFDKKQKEAQKKTALAGFDKGDAETISKVFDKLDGVGGTFEENMSLAIDKVLPGQSANLLKTAINSPGGGPPKPPKAGEASPDLKNFGASAFGLTDKDFENAK